MLCHLANDPILSSLLHNFLKVFDSGLAPEPRPLVHVEVLVQCPDGRDERAHVRQGHAVEVAQVPAVVIAPVMCLIVSIHRIVPLIGADAKDYGPGLWQLDECLIFGPECEDLACDFLAFIVGDLPIETRGYYCE